MTPPRRARPAQESPPLYYIGILIVLGIAASIGFTSAVVSFFATGGP